MYIMEGQSPGTCSRSRGNEKPLLLLLLHLLLLLLLLLVVKLLLLLSFGEDENDWLGLGLMDIIEELLAEE